MLAVLPELILKTRLSPPPLTVMLSPLLLLMVTLVSTTNSPVVSGIVCGPGPRLNVIVSPVHTLASASRSEPGPPSAALVTIGSGVQALTSW